MSGRWRTAHVVVTLAAGERPDHVPAHLDVLAGAARPVGSLDGGRVDRAIERAAGAFRAAAVFHARRGFGRVGSRARRYDDLEERHGLSRTYRLELADPSGAEAAVARLRELETVESAARELLATAPAEAVVAEPLVRRDDVEAPHRMVGAAEALAMEPGDERVTVAVVDTGVALGHPEFQRKLLSGYDSVELGLGRISSTMTLVGDSHGRDFSAYDGVGHGSHVAGIVGAQGWQVPPGVAGRSLLLPVRVLAAGRANDRPTVTGVGAIGDIDAGLKVALDLGAQVMNMSFGTPRSALDPETPPPHRSVIGYAAEQGCVLVAASGNSGAEEDFYPAAYDEVIAVGSVSAAGARSEFSTYGDHLTISAPGEDVMSVGRRGYRRSSGTSHAAPFVSGAAALLLARARRGGQRLAPAEVEQILTTAARPSPSPAEEAGAGVLDVPAAIRALDAHLSAHGSTQRTVQREGATHG